MNPENPTLLDLLSIKDDELGILAQKDSAAYAELYHRYFSRVYRYLLVKAGNFSAAQEITARTFLTALENLPTFQEGSSFAAWLLGIAYNESAAHFRKHKPQRESHGFLDQPDATLPSASVSEECFRLDGAAIAFQKISPEKAEAIMLKIFAGLSTAQIGTILNVSPDTVKMWILCGLRDLQGKLAPTLEDEP